MYMCIFYSKKNCYVTKELLNRRSSSSGGGGDDSSSSSSSSIYERWKCSNTTIVNLVTYLTHKEMYMMILSWRFIFIVMLCCCFGSFGRFEGSERQILWVRLHLYGREQNKPFFLQKVSSLVAVTFINTTYNYIKNVYSPSDSQMWTEYSP
jgi:hypothetical protein